jgi:phosphopantothenoylcysteine decarboxylase/phosphopantothenate--cysteine ligase
MAIALKRTRDIAAELGQRKGNRILVGFAMETQNEQANAEDKLRRKNFDFIVLNSLRIEGAGFRGDTNVVSLIDAAGRKDLPLMSKREVAEHIVDKIEKSL